MKRYAILFPQFYPVEVNDLAWGKGFTDWMLVATANAFDYWDRRAPARGFYDLSKSSDIQATFDVASDAGLDGFGIYHYRFDDGPELDMVERYLRHNSPKPGFRYFFIWANESWSRRWAGRNTDILKRVSTAPSREQVRNHILYLKPHMESDAYTLIGKKPMFVIYRPEFFTDPLTTIALYRDEFERAGVYPSIGFFLKNISDAQYADVFDFCYLFEPRLFFNFRGLRSSRVVVNIYKKLLHLVPYERFESFSERLSQLLNSGSATYSFAEFYAYFTSVERERLLNSLACPIQNVLTCGWNNVPRYRRRFTKVEVPMPEQFSAMLKSSLDARNLSDNIPLLCNAWNEWSEGAAIEPCYYLGDEMLKSYLSLRQHD